MSLIKQAPPPANSITRLTPEKEETNQKKVPNISILDSITDLTGNIYFAIDNPNDPDFGKNGFLSADRFRSGDCLPLLNDQISENFDLPKLEICDYGDCNKAKIDYFDDKKNNNDILRNLEEGKCVSLDTKRTAALISNNAGPQSFTTTAPSNTSNTTTTTTSTTLGHRNLLTNLKDDDCNSYRYPHPQHISPQRLQLELNHGQHRTIEKKRRKPQYKDKAQIIKPQDEPGYVGHKDVDVIMKTMGFEQPQQKQQRSQKATSPGNGSNIGTVLVSSSLSINCGNSSTKKQISKKQKQKPRQMQQQKNISSLKQQNSNKLNTSVNDDDKQTLNFKSISLDRTVIDSDEEEQEEERDVSIELDNNNEQVQKQNEDNIINAEFLNDNKKEVVENVKDLNKQNEIKEVKEIEKQNDIQQNLYKQPENKPKWTSSRIDEKKRKIEETSLIERIPKHLLVSFGWRNPITILSPFANRLHDKQPLSVEEANKIWEEKPAPERFLEKNVINKKIYQNLSETQLEKETNCSQVDEEPPFEIQVEDEPMDTRVDEQTQNNPETMNSTISPTCETETATTLANPMNVTLPQTLANSFALARIADFFAKKDERILRCHGFKPIFIPCERLELVLQRDRKDVTLRKMKEEREKRMAENEEKRRRNKNNFKIGNDLGSDEREKKRRKKDKRNDHKRHHSPSNIYSGSVRNEAKPPLKRNFTPVVQCCVCELIVSKERFGGRDTLFCSEACISKKAEQARRCVKEGERILLMDHKDFFFIEEANRLGHDPIYQKKVESMRVDVRKAIETALQKRSKAVNMNFSLKRYKELGVEIERALFSIHHDVNLRYRKWFKNFITVVNDENNLFFRDLLRDKVSVKKLVTLSVDQMCSSTSQIDPNFSTSTNITRLKSASIVAAADSTSISDMLEENINTELLASTTTLRNKIASTTIRHSMIKKTPLITAKTKSAIDDILGDMYKDTTHLHHSHLYDANCGVCKQNNLRKFAEKEHLERLEAKLEQERKSEEAKNGNVNFQNLDPSIQAAMLEDMSTEMTLNELDPLRRKHRDMAVRSADSYAITGDNNVLIGGNLGIGDDPIDQERHLRDPLDLESVNTRPSEQIYQNEGDTGSFDGGSGGNDDDNAFCDLNDGCFEPEAQQHQQQHIDFMEQDLGMDINPSPYVFCSRIEISKKNEITSQRPPPFEQSDTREVATDKNDSWLRVQKSSDIPNLFDHEALDPRLTHLVWKGKFVWNSFISFDCTLAAISNTGAVKAGRELPLELSVLGRSEANGVWHYIGSLKDSWDKQVILLLVEHPKDLHQYDLYLHCFDKVSSCDKQQIIVLDFKGHKQIKDGYVFTQTPENQLPSIFYPLDGPGLPERCKGKNHMILILIRRMDREDKILRKRLADNWPPTALQPCNIPTERLDLQSTNISEERQQNLILLDPRLDKNLTRHSKCYRPHHLFREMPHLFNDIMEQFNSEDDEGSPPPPSIATIKSCIRNPALHLPFNVPPILHTSFQPLPSPSQPKKSVRFHGINFNNLCDRVKTTTNYSLFCEDIDLV
ncbi:TFIIS central domain-containing protein [Meloidogyne graminicola]|uniref:TFIIS central domain-containing protein n=1 Tax=Meloidogyne graminicola TaxID=189291 RepID=A0A8S9ZML9_9BILA|nr:TFIIS central domain-containing protein [Meloidogyne graminicola]